MPQMHHWPDQLIVKSSLSFNVKEPGTDIVGIYGTNVIGFSAGECKAYLERPSQAITDACKQLGRYDSRTKDKDVRAAISQFRSFLPTDAAQSIARAFWRDERTYFPMICCDNGSAINWDTERQSISQLKRPPNRKFVVPLAIEQAITFFDRLSDAIRSYAKGC